MGERAIENRIKKLKALEEQKKELETQISELQEEIKKDMEIKGVEEMKIGIFIVRFTSVLSNRFDTKAFKEKYDALYKDTRSRYQADVSQFHKRKPLREPRTLSEAIIETERINSITH